MTVLPFSARQAPTTRPTYPVPTTAIFMSQQDRQAWVQRARCKVQKCSCKGAACTLHLAPCTLHPAPCALHLVVTSPRARSDRLSSRAAEAERRRRIHSPAREGARRRVSTRHGTSAARGDA